MGICLKGLSHEFKKGSSGQDTLIKAVRVSWRASGMGEIKMYWRHAGNCPKERLWAMPRGLMETCWQLLKEPCRHIGRIYQHVSRDVVIGFLRQKKSWAIPCSRGAPPPRIRNMFYGRTCCTVAVLRIRISKDPHYLSQSGSTTFLI